MSDKKVRRQFSAEQKAGILRRHLVDKVAVSDLCDECSLQPSVFYGWQRQLLENAALALEPTGRKKRSDRESALEDEVEALATKLAKKDDVIVELSAEFVSLKKELGES